MKILLLGKNGQIGWELQRTLAPLGEIIALGRQELDLTDQNAIRHTVRAVKPDLIVNAAAYTFVEKAEEEPEMAMAVNGIAPGILAEEAALIKAAIVHYSTDYVFDGNKNEPYTERDNPNPINVYGKTKLAGEEAIIEKQIPHLILRTGWVYGLRGKNFLLTVLKLAAERTELTIVDDQHGAPTWSRLVSEATALLIAQNPFSNISKNNLYHLTAAGETSWFGFAQYILKHANQIQKPGPALKAIKTEDYPTLAARPLNSVLDNSLIGEHCAIIMPDWRKQLKLALNLRGNETIKKRVN